MSAIIPHLLHNGHVDPRAAAPFGPIPTAPHSRGDACACAARYCRERAGPSPPPALSDRLGCPAIPALCHALAQFAHPRRTLRRQYGSRPVSTQAHSCTMTVHALALSARPVWGTSAVLSVLVMTTRAGSSAPPLRSVSVTTHALSFLWVTVTVLCVLATDTASARVSYHP